ncbi:TPA: type II toxin-antitoxin system VapC family toxin [Legionella feeleii]|uniref:Ribonuclease VapC n=1 Tax=Legionella feeleii TaxID=453 RepID=A0A378IY77_9GAMM|nr:type II toxin-antitoxin system VapC family toxin [Legionella feeleii]STX39860.1 Probable ribonuclease FitB [Legionella feeleii]
MSNFLDNLSGYLLDTNIISELVKPKPNEKVMRRLQQKDSSMLFISVLTLGEIRKGINGITDPQKYGTISHFLEVQLPDYFEERILPIDQKIADMWGQVQSKLKGHHLSAIDALIAATAIVHNLKLVTRNVKDFVHIPVEIINPWEDE